MSCSAGNYVPPCEDSDECTDDALRPVDCDDGNPCTVDRLAADGFCQQQNVADGTSCGASCYGPMACQAGTCIGTDPVVCTPGTDPCLAGNSCDSATGACTGPALGDGDPCDDGDLCTTGDSCQTGVCMDIGSFFECVTCLEGCPEESGMTGDASCWTPYQELMSCGATHGCEGDLENDVCLANNCCDEYRAVF